MNESEDNKELESLNISSSEDSWSVEVRESRQIDLSDLPSASAESPEEDLNFEEEDENLKVTESYYESNAQIIKKNFPQGYQIALIKNPKCKSKSLKIQNFSYLAELIDFNQKTFIAEVGCGNGQFLNYLSSVDKYRGFQYFGIDISENQIENAKGSTEYNRKSFRKVDMHNFFSYEPYFDAIYFIESIGYAVDLETVVQSISSGVKIGGRVIIKNPVKIVVNQEKYEEVKEKFSLIESEYGYSKNSLGMLPDKELIEKTFLDNGFELEKFEIPEYDTSTYNKTFSKVKSLSSQHQTYIDHITNMTAESYYPNKYLECAVFVFKKIKDIVIDTPESEPIASNVGMNAVNSAKFESLLNEELDNLDLNSSYE